ncbi:MAG: DotA [Gammaproteobacteria bacterium]|jgi:conjugal transfer/type IV secretion protein DotA/TraY|nr:DotA [Gammaproteobacteria bacterium]
MIRILLAIALLLGLPGFALAQDSGSVLGMPNVTDTSVIFLSYVFGAVNGVLHGSGSQIMGAMFAKFNSAILVLGGLVVMYTTLMSILNTAHEGEIMGRKFHSFFVPFRTALGILLIAPTATGYSWIQVLVIWVVLQGVSAANMVWNAAVTYLMQGGAIIVQNQDTSGFLGFKGQGVSGQAQSILSAVTCLELTRRAIDESVYSSSGAITAPSQDPLESVFKGIRDNSQSASGLFTVDMPNYLPANSGTSSPDQGWSFLTGMCGSLSFNKYDANQALGLEQMMTDVSEAVPSFTSTCDAKCYDSSGSIVDCPAGSIIPNDAASCPTEGTCYANGFIKSAQVNPFKVASKTVPILSWCNPSPGLSASATNPSNLMLTYNTAIMDYMGLAQTNNQNTTQAFDEYGTDPTKNYHDALNDILNPNVKDISSTTNEVAGNGWFMAGAYYFKLLQSNENAQLNHSSGSVGWTISGPKSPGFTQSFESKFSVAGSEFLAQEDYFKTWLLPFFNDNSGSLTPASDPANNSLVNNFDQAQQQISVGHTHVTLQTPSATGITTGGWIVLNAILPGLSDMITSFTALMQAQQNNANPVILMMIFGSGMSATAIAIWLTAIGALSIIGFATSIIPSVTVSDVFTTIGVVITPLLSAILLPMFVTGIMLEYYLPMVPFMIFSFGVVGWIVGVIEAMVAAPIVAFAIMNPEGSDVFGKADPGVMLLLNLFLRPSLMIFGLVAGIMVSYIGVWIINEGFALILPAITAVQTGNYISQSEGTGVGFGLFFICPTCGLTDAMTLAIEALIGAVALPVMYLLMVMQVINRSFTLIYILPDKITRWMSGGMQESLGSEWSGAEKDVKGGAEKAAGALGEGGRGGASGAVDRYRQRRKDAKDKAEKEGTVAN